VEHVIDALIDKLLAGGPVAGWALAVYLLVRLHQLTDRQHSANLKTVRALTAIKTVLFVRANLVPENDEGESE
jgi:hypothetical protein